jgi:F-type H+-transporting ATPase subunit b
MKNRSQKTQLGVQTLKKLILPFFIFSLTFAAYAFGSGGGEEGEHGSILKDYIYKIINFLILVIILFKFGKKPLGDFLKKRTELIEKTLTEAKEAKEAALKALKEAEERLKTKDAEVAAIVAAAKKSGEVERDRIIEESGKLKEKILEQAKTNIEFELKHAKESIKAEAVELAMELAEKKLKDKLTRGEQERLLDESLVKIGGRG